MNQLKRSILVLLLVVELQNYSVNSMQLYRRIIRQYGHPPFEQIILKPVYQPIHPHRPYHPIVKFDEAPVHSIPYNIYHHYDPSFDAQQNGFHPIPNPNIFQPLVKQTAIHPQSQVQNLYAMAKPVIKSNQYRVQNPDYRKPFKQTRPLPIRYSKPRAKPDYDYHNPSHHYIPLSHDHHENYRDEYHQNSEDSPRPIKSSPVAHTNHADIKEVSTKHVTNMESIKMMNDNDTGSQQNKEGSEEEPLDRPDVSKTTGPVFTYVKTDPHANIKWGVRHYVGRKYN